MYPDLWRPDKSLMSSGHLLLLVNIFKTEHQQALRKLGSDSLVGPTVQEEVSKMFSEYTKRQKIHHCGRLRSKRLAFPKLCFWALINPNCATIWPTGLCLLGSTCTSFLITGPGFMFLAHSSSRPFEPQQATKTTTNSTNTDDDKPAQTQGLNPGESSSSAWWRCERGSALSNV